MQRYRHFRSHEKRFEGRRDAHRAIALLWFVVLLWAVAARPAPASLTRKPARAVQRSSSLVWLPDVRDRLELLERHGDRVLEPDGSPDRPARLPLHDPERLLVPRREGEER